MAVNKGHYRSRVSHLLLVDFFEPFAVLLKLKNTFSQLDNSVAEKRNFFDGDLSQLGLSVALEKIIGEYS